MWEGVMADANENPVKYFRACFAIFAILCRYFPALS